MRRVLVYGAGESAQRIVHAMLGDPEAGYLPVGLIDDDPTKHADEIEGVAVLGPLRALPEMVRATAAEVMVIAIATASRAVMRAGEAAGRNAGLQVLVLPTTSEILAQTALLGVRDIDEADLLDETHREIDVDAVRRLFVGRRVLLTGAGGVIGTALAQQLLQLGVTDLVLLDKDDAALHELSLSLFGAAVIGDPRFVVADVRDRDRMLEVVGSVLPQVVLHAASMTRRDLVDAHPQEAYKTNVEGTKNLVQAALEQSVGVFMNLSTHHAADPMTTLGATQYEAELITSRAANESGHLYASVRFGHVLGGRSSLLSSLRHQVANGADVVIPGPDSVIHVTTAAVAASRVLEAATVAKPGEIVAVEPGPAVRLEDLAERLMRRAHRHSAIVYSSRPNDDSGNRTASVEELSVAYIDGPFVHIAAPERPGFVGDPSSVGVRLGGAGTPDRILLSAPDVGPAERQALIRAFDSGWIAPLGPEVDAFEAELAAYVGAESCVALATGTAALQLALIALGIRPGDEVVVQSATFAATAFAVVHAGGVPIFADSNHATWNLDPDMLESFLERRASEHRLPKAVMPVDLYGMLADYERLEAICERFGVLLVEDAAESLGSIARSGRMGGTFGAAGVVSFNGNKIITTSGGGALFGPPELTARVRFLATQAREPELHYEHLTIGHNARLSNLLAGMGRVQLAGLEDKIARRTEIYDHYRKELPTIEWIPDGVTARPNHWLSVGLLPPGVSPAVVCQSLAKVGVESRPAWKPMHAQPVFAANERIGDAVSDEVFARGICLPSGSGMSDAELERVVVAMAAVLETPFETIGSDGR